MASNREERFLMRQRGAGARQLRNSGFDFNLPGALRSPLKPALSGRSRRTPVRNSQTISTTRKTPRVTPLVPQRSSRRTPGSRSTQNPSSSSSRKLVSISEQQDGAIFQATKTDGQGSVTKKRKLGRLLERENLPPSEEEDVGAASVFGSVRKSPAVAVGSDQRESAALPTTSPAKKRKKRKSIGQQSKKRARTSLLATNDPSPRYPTWATPTPTQEQQTQTDKPTTTAPQVESLTDSAPVVEQAKRKRKKRKSIGKPKVKRKSLEAMSSSSRPVDIEPSLPTQKNIPNALKVREARQNLASVEEEPEDELEGPPEITRSGPQRASTPTIASASSQSRPRGRPRKLDQETRQSKPQKIPRSTIAAPKASQRPLAPQSSLSTTAPSKQPSRRQKPNTIPITVYRISHPQPLTTLLPNEDPLSALPPFPKNSSVNAIDVLSQVCSEVLAKSISTMKENAADEERKPQKAEWLRKAQAVEIYRDDLDARLFQMTEALDNNHALTVRLRQARKQKACKRDALLDLKRRRDDIALETDAVRAKHERDTKIAQDENDLATMIQDVELAVQRGRAVQEAGGDEHEGREAGLELRLRKVAAEVSSAGGGGLLEKVRRFNTLMERAVGGA